MARCSSCGQELEEGFFYCPTCGRRIDRGTVAGVGVSAQQIDREASAPPAKADCEHRNVVQIPVFEVGGEPRRVTKKCLDCGKVVGSTTIDR